MSCTVKTKVLDDLKDKKIISNTREILDFKEFDRLNALYTKHAVEKYDLPTNGKLLMDAVPSTVKLGKGNRIRPVNERTIYRAVPNDKLMDLLDDIIVDYKENNNFESKNFSNINYQLKSIDILNSTKAEQVFEKGKKNGWSLNKILTELQVPKAQKQIILDKGISNREDIITSLLADNSFTIEINTAKSISAHSSQKVQEPSSKEEFDSIDVEANFTGDPLNPSYEKVTDDYIYELEQDPETGEEFYTKYSQKQATQNTQHYSNLTVPGGTNYTENEIATPAITPSIKGHAQFATDNGIGWFRSDDKTNDKLEEAKELDNDFLSNLSEAEREIVGDKDYSNITKESTKTRRILEVQSDLFQKGRDKKDLVKFQERVADSQQAFTERDADELTDQVNVDGFQYLWNDYYNKGFKYPESVSIGTEGSRDKGIEITKEEFLKALNKAKIEKVDKNQNQFLQLLNKKNNWVTFFVKSVIQDSVKKGYEKVLFPKGDTAAKIEGHQTLEEFKKQKEARIKEIEATTFENTYKISTLNEDATTGGEYKTKQEAENFLNNLPEEIRNDYKVILSEPFRDRENLEREKARLKQELADVESGQTQLSSIAKFYENTVTDILKKQGYNPVEITDEYGNKWNEVDLSQIKSDDVIFLKRIENLLDENKKDILFSEDKTQIDNDNTNSQTENLNNFILFNNQDGKFTAKDVLNNIKTNFQGFNKSSNEIIDKLIPILERTNATIKFVSNSALSNEDTLMEYNPKSNEIRVSRDKLNDISEEYAVRTFLHEVVHSITIDAYVRPESIEAQMFRDFIDSMYNKYKELSGYKEGDPLTSRNYGFTNQIEFIAEIMTNPKFQAKIKELEGNKSWWNKLVDYIRTLVGLRKTSDYNNAIEYITNIALQSDYQGGLSVSNAIFEKKKTEEEDDIEDKRYYKLRTIQDRLSYTYDKIKDNIDQNLANYEKLIKVSKNSEKIEHYRDKLQELLNELEQVESDNEWKGIAIYTEQLLSNIRQLEDRFNKEDLSLEEADKTIYIYGKYLEANSLVKPVQYLISEAKRKKDLPITREELDAIDKMLTEASGKYSKIESEISSYSKEAAVRLLNDRIYAPKVLFRWKEKLTREHKELGINENVTSWVVRQMNTTYKDEIDQEVLENAEDLVNDPSFDISMSSRLFDAALNTNNELVQVTQTIIDKMRNKIVEEKRTLSLELQSLFEEFINEKGDNKPSTLYKNMYEEDSEGNVYLKGEYSVKFKEQYDKIRSEHSAKLAEIESEYGRGSAEFKNFYKNSDFKKWKDSNLKEITVDGKKKIIPADKWKTDLSNMSEIEVKVLKKAREVFEKSQWQTYKINSLISDPFYGVKTYSLPAITASSLENILEGKVKELGKDKIKDLTSIRLDDVGYEETYTDISGNPIRNVKVHFRGKLDRGQQSLDLFSLMALEGYNGINYRNKQETESSLKTILDIAKNKVYYETEGLGTQILSRRRKRQRAVVKDSSKSNVYKRLESLMEMNIYDIMHKDMGTLGPVDINKAIGAANGWTAMVGLSLNEISATANILNGKAQLFLEGIAGNYISFGAIAKAEARYFSELHNSFKDINKPVATSFINQLTEMFDTYGAISVSMKQAFIKNGILKSNLNAKSLQFMQDSGEHWMQSVLTMAVLEDIKVMDKDGNFLDKEGNIVKNEKKAASLLDMAKMKDGKLAIDEKVIYTTKTVGIKYNEGGKEMIAKLVKKKVFDTAGVYDSNMQPEIMRHGVGKLLMMYRKFLVPLGMARFRGLAYSHKKLPDLEDHQVFFSHALQDYETGTYTEAVRYILTSTLETLQQRKYDAFVTNWKELTTTQRKQFHKTTAELVIMFVLLPALATLLTAMGGDDGDDDLLAFILLETVRLESELRSFSSIDDQWKILNSPIPSLRIVESATDLFTSLFQPWNWLDEIEGGKNKGKLRIQRTLQSVTPVWSSQDRTYKEYRTYIQNQAK